MRRLPEPCAVLFANGIGDHIMTLPALRALASLSDQNLTLLGMPGLAEDIFSEIQFSRVVDIGMTNRHGRNVFDAEAISNLPITVAELVSFNPWHSPDVNRLLAHLRPHHSTGMYPEFQTQVEPRRGEHAVDRAFRVVSAFAPGLSINDFSAPLPLKPAAKRTAHARLTHLTGHSQKLLAVHNETLEHKVWDERRWLEVLARFLAHNPDFALVALDANNTKLASLADHPRAILPRQLALNEAFALIAAADLFIGPDSCMLHAADSLRVRGVGLFGPAPSAPLGSDEFGFRFGPHLHLSGGGNMDNISVDAVLAALQSIRPEAGCTPRRRAAELLG